MFEVTRAQALNESTFCFRIHAPRIAKKVAAGQFLILRIDEKGERVPFTVSDYDRQQDPL